VQVIDLFSHSLEVQGVQSWEVFANKDYCMSREHTHKPIK